MQSQQVLLDIIVQDLHRSGVSDFVVDDEFDFFSGPLNASLAVSNFSSNSNSSVMVGNVNSTAGVADSSAISSLPQVMPKPEDKEVTNNSGVVGESVLSEPSLLSASDIFKLYGGSCNNLVIVSSDIVEASGSVNDNFKDLLINMLKAIDINFCEVSLLSVMTHNSSGYDLPLDMVMPHIEYAFDLIEKSKANNVIILGQSVARVCLADEESSLTQMRFASAQGDLQLAGKVTCITYGLDVLSSHPVLKRKAWEDLLSFRAKVK